MEEFEFTEELGAERLNQLSGAVFVNHNILISKIREQEVPILYRWRSNPMVNHYLQGPAPGSLTEQWNWYENVASSLSSIYFIVTTIEPELKPIGYCQLVSIDLSTRTAEFGVVVGEAELWGQGLGTRIAITLYDIAFDFLGLEALYSNVNPENIGALTALDSLHTRPIDSSHRYSKPGENLYCTLKDEYQRAPESANTRLR